MLSEKVFAVGCHYGGAPYVSLVIAEDSQAAAELAVERAHAGLEVTWVQYSGQTREEIVGSPEWNGNFGGHRKQRVSVKTMAPPPPPKPKTVVTLGEWV